MYKKGQIFKRRVLFWDPERNIYAFYNTAQEAIGLFQCRGALLAHNHLSLPFMSNCYPAGRPPDCLGAQSYFLHFQMHELEFYY